LTAVVVGELLLAVRDKLRNSLRDLTLDSSTVVTSLVVDELFLPWVSSRTDYLTWSPVQSLQLWLFVSNCYLSGESSGTAYLKLESSTVLTAVAVGEQLLAVR
jgi:hypothetical protein